MHERAHTLLRGAAAAAAANLAKAGSWGSGTACVTWNLSTGGQRRSHHSESGVRRQNGDLHMGQTLLWLVLNHLYRQAEWNLYLHVRHAIFGRERSTGWMTL